MRIKGCRLQPKQTALYELLLATGPSVATILGFGGAKGGGKSAGIRNCAILLAGLLGQQYPGITVTIIRRVYDDLKKNHLDELFAAYPQLYEYWHKDDKELRFPGGGRVVFAFAETEGDVKRKFLGGYQSAFIMVDEAQQFTEEELHWIKSANRWTRIEGGIPDGFCKMVLLFNPGGKGSGYIKRIFWDRKYVGKEQPYSYAFIHAFGWDNYEWFRGQVDISEDDFYNILTDQERFDLFINKTRYGGDMNAMPESIREGYLLGNFEHFEGQYYAGAWNADYNVLTPAQVRAIIKPWWQRWMAQDWGFGDHTAHYWFATGILSPTEWIEQFGGSCDRAMQVTIAYREFICNNTPEADLAQKIAEMTPYVERKYIQRFFLSVDAFGKAAKQAGGHTVGDQYKRILSDHSLPAPEPAIQDRVQGARWLYNCFRQAHQRGHIVDYLRARMGPAMFASADCVEVQNCVPQAIRAEKNPEDVEQVPGELWEDVCDSLRYGAYSMQGANWVAPVEFRRAELYDSYDVPAAERTTPQMTALAMAMRQFDAGEQTTGRIRRR